MTIEVDHLSFRYRADGPLVLDDVSLRVEPGARCLLLGANGAGKTTFLRILAGRHMVPRDAVRVLGRCAFHDTSLATEVTILGGIFPFTADVAVEAMLASAPPSDRARRARLVELLGVDVRWHMHEVSDGQRRRVQILLGLLTPPSVLLLDEVTTDLDVIAREDLLAFLRDDCEERGTTIVYATHIFDMLDEWATHVVFMDRGRIARMSPIREIVELEELRRGGAPSPLLRLVVRWLRASR